MLVKICLTIILLWCKSVQIKAQCTIKGDDVKDAVSVQDIAEEILQLRNRLDNHDQNQQLQFQKLLNQTERQVKGETQNIADQMMQLLWNRLDYHDESIQLQFQKLSNQTEIEARRSENEYKVTVQGIADQLMQIWNRLDNHDQNLQLQFQKLLNQTENQVKGETQSIADQMMQLLRNRLDNQDQNLQLQFQKMLNETENQVQGIADQLMQIWNRLDNHDQNLLLLFRKLLNQTENQVKGETQGIADQIFQLRNRLDNHDQSLQLQFQKLLNQTENQGNEDKNVALAQAISNLTSQLQNRLDDHNLKLQLQFQNLVNQTERQVTRCEIEDKVATQGIADQILQLQNQTVQLMDLVTQIQREDICGLIPTQRDCSDIRAKGKRRSGLYTVCVEYQQKLYSAKAYCDMTSTNGTSWLVFQRRKDGSVDFYRNWREYETGFGDLNGEFWLGNEILHLLTSKRNYKLRIELEDFEGNRRYAEYARFSIGSPNDKYTMSVSGYSGNAGDSFSYHNGMRFSTKDADNDVDSGREKSCAETFHGAWWYRHCYEVNLNGKYHRRNYSKLARSEEGVTWNLWLGSWYSLKTTEMKIAPVI